MKVQINTLLTAVNCPADFWNDARGILQTATRPVRMDDIVDDGIQWEYTACLPDGTWYTKDAIMYALPVDGNTVDVVWSDRWKDMPFFDTIEEGNEWYLADRIAYHMFCAEARAEQIRDERFLADR